MIQRWWDCPECQQGSSMDADKCQDCGYYRWDHPDPSVLERQRSVPSR